MQDPRFGARLGYQIRKVVRPGGKNQWQVQFYGWGEAALQTDGTPNAQVDSDDPLGVATNRTREAPIGAWLGGNATLGDTYVFDSRQEAEDFPWKYARNRARQLHDIAISNNPISGPLTGLAKKLPWVGDGIQRLLRREPMPPPVEWSAEVGPTAGLTAKGQLGKLLGVSAGLRGWHQTGVRRAANGDLTVTFKSSGEVESSVVFDLGVVMPQKARERFNGAVNQGIDELERLAQRKYGAPLKLPAQMRLYLTKNWPDFGATAKGKGTTSYQFTLDRSGRPVRFTKLVDTQLNWFGRAADKVSTVDRLKQLAVNVQVPQGGSRTIEQSTLEVNDRANLQAVRDFLWYAPLGVAAELTPAADGLRRRFETAGTMTRQTYDSSVGNAKVSAQVLGDLGRIFGELKLERESNALAGAEIWQNGKGRVPWAECHA
ncbi:hypothetical protein [Actinomadura alba]|uniref:Uncharacterized protein n=1 Tax=Actinomadura alba TaxID=406431 RepID=A0ABR7LQL5_9ACTN|nr:hypothetical protein [Actinomadura alba]MBC6467064.1 hypothetical protein [Actinomadura alba]